MALSPKSFSEIITFSRSSAGTRINASGLVESVAAGSPRFDYAPVTLAARGLLIEEQRANLQTYSEHFENAAYRKNGLSVSVNSATAPDGATSADLLTGSGAGAQSFDIYPTDYGLSGSVVQTFSIYVKQPTSNAASTIQIDLASTGSVLNLSTGAITNAGGGAPSAGSSAVQVGNGWWRFSVSTVKSNVFHYWAVRLPDASSQAVLVWGAQLEAGSFATSYIPSTVTFTGRSSTGTFIGSNGLIQTASAGVARYQYNPANLSAAPFLLLEAAATNLVTQSQTFSTWIGGGYTLTTNAAVSPDGTTNAASYVPTTVNTSHNLALGTTFGAGTFTFSVYAKANGYPRLGIRVYDGAAYQIFTTFDISAGTVVSVPVGTASITSVGNGWYRCVCTGTSASGNMGSVAGWTIESFPSINTLQQTFTGDGVSGAYIWGAQVETNSYATSYIPTTTAQVTRAADTSTSAQTTRSADVASINTMTPWFSSTQGTLFGQFDTVASGTRTVADINDGTGNESIRLGSVGTDPYFTVTDGGVDQATIDAGSIASSTSYKFAAAYKANDFAACIGGGTVQVDTSGTLPTVNQVLLGTSAASNNLNGHLQRITYYPSKLTNAELQALTA